MNYHRNAATNKVQRQQIQSSNDSTSLLAERFQISQKTVRKWKSRTQAYDWSSRPHMIHTALSEGEHHVITIIRKLTWGACYEVAEAVKHVIPHANQTNVSRSFVKNKVNQKPQAEKQLKSFKEYSVGFIHIDVTYIPKLESQKKYLFVAIDRSTRLLFVELLDSRSQKDAVSFLEKCKRFFPFKIRKVLTDNGSEFTNETYKLRTRKKETPLREHDFTKICRENEIEHRTTKIRHPWTNGMVERVNGLIKEKTIKIHRYENYKELAEDVKRYEMRYNVYQKRNALKRKTPYQQLCKEFESNPKNFWQEPEEWLFTNYKVQPYEH